MLINENQLMFNISFYYNLKVVKNLCFNETLMIKMPHKLFFLSSCGKLMSVLMVKLCKLKSINWFNTISLSEKG